MKEVVERVEDLGAEESDANYVGGVSYWRLGTEVTWMIRLGEIGIEKVCEGSLLKVEAAWGASF